EVDELLFHHAVGAHEAVQIPLLFAREIQDVLQRPTSLYERPPGDRSRRLSSGRGSPERLGPDRFRTRGYAPAGVPAFARGADGRSRVRGRGRLRTGAPRGRVSLPRA